MEEKKMYRLVPLFREKLWGNRRLHEVYGYATGDRQIGEGWIVSSLAGHEDNVLENAGLTLSEAYQKHKADWFGITDGILPIKAMLVSTSRDVSIQCHPDDAYAMAHDHSLGKPEAWYVLDAKPGAKIIFGHTAKTQEEFRQMIAANRWNELIRYVYPRKGDFLYVPEGTMHAIGEDMMVMEISRNADLTYRLYDYDRIDKDGRKRQLDVEKALDVIHTPFHETGLIRPDGEKRNGLLVTTFFDVPGKFTFRRLYSPAEGTYEQPEFAFYLINDGGGTINGTPVNKGEVWFLPRNSGPVSIHGCMEILLSSYRAQ